MEKVIRENMVAVLYSPGHGAGFYTWNKAHPQLMFHPKLVSLVESKKLEKITEEFIKDELGIEHVYCSFYKELEIEWIPCGKKFLIIEYDGHEYIITEDDMMTA